jgi:hypothetical protein
MKTSELTSPEVLFTISLLPPSSETPAHIHGNLVGMKGKHKPIPF